MREAPVRLLALYGPDGTPTQALLSLRLRARFMIANRLKVSCGQQIPSPLTIETAASLCLPGELAKQGQAKMAEGRWPKDIIMAEPERPQLTPYQVELEAGKHYAWCRCGRSNKQPFCDGSHAGTGIEPLMFTAERTELALLCGCKDTGDPPYCDGSHLLL
jgi:CDGSH-type Zn-finger protein